MNTTGRASEAAHFGTLLKRYRGAAGLTQELLAERAGLSVRGVSDLERGVNRAPHAQTVHLLASALGLSAHERAALEAAVRRSTQSAPAAFAAAPSPAPPAVPPLVGRAAPLRLLECHLAGEGPPVLALAGEPGIGKTRLLREAVPRAARQGWTVLQGGCRQRGGQGPYAPLLDALAGSLRRRPAEQQRADLRGCAWLVRLLPELADGPIEPLPTWRIPAEQERRLLFGAVERLLGNLAGPAGTLLILDDLQWAGPDALDLLAALAWSAKNAPLRVLVAYRDTEVHTDSPLAALLADLANAGLAAHCTLAPLSPGESGQLLDYLLEPADAAGAEPRKHLLRTVGGVPFFLVSYAQGLRSGALNQGSGVPWNLSQSLRQRVAALPEAGREIVAAAAVLGRVAARSVLLTMVERQEAEAVTALEAACRARLLEEKGRDAYRFAHDVIREVVEADLSAARCAVLHRRAAEALEAQPAGGQIEALAYHCEQGEAWAKAQGYLALAGDRAFAACATQAAVDYYARAYAACMRLGDAALPAAIEVAHKRGFVYGGLADFHAARLAFRQMSEAAERLGDRRRYGMALAYRGAHAVSEHVFDEAEPDLRAALVVAGEGYEDVAFAANVGLIHHFICRNRLADAAPPLQAAQALEDRVKDAGYRSKFLTLVAGLHNWAARFDEAMEVVARWRSVAEESARTGNLGWLQGHLWHEGLIRGGRGEYRQALEALRRALAISERRRDPHGMGQALNTLGWIHGELQDHKQAIALNTQSLQTVLQVQWADPEVQHNARLNLGDSLLALGRLDEADEQFQIVERTVREPRPPEEYMLWRYSQHLFHSYGALWLARGDPERALVYAGECLALAESSQSRKNVVKARRLRGQALLALGKPAEATREIEIALSLARQVGNPPQLWKTLVALGDLRQFQGRGDDAVQAYREALQIIDGVAAALADPVLRETFLTSRHVEHIRRLASHGS